MSEFFNVLATVLMGYDFDHDYSIHSSCLTYCRTPLLGVSSLGPRVTNLLREQRVCTTLRRMGRGGAWRCSPYCTPITSIIGTKRLIAISFLQPATPGRQSPPSARMNETSSCSLFVARSGTAAAHARYNLSHWRTGTMEQAGTGRRLHGQSGQGGQAE